MKHFFTLLLTLVCLTTTAQDIDSLKTKILQPSAMQADFKYLRRLLEETHPGLYRYNTKEQMNHKMDSLYGLLNAEMKFYDYYGLLASLIADIRCAHTTILPESDINKIFAKCKTFPYWVYFIEGHVYTIAIGTGDTLVKPGFELLSINGQPIDSINQIIFKHLWGDGYISISRQRMLDQNFFPLFYYFFVAQQDTFLIKWRTPDRGTIETKTIAQTMPVSLKTLFKNPVNKKVLEAGSKENKLDQKNPWRIKVYKEHDAVVMRIRGFGGASNGDEAPRKMRDFMDASMKKIKSNNIGNLIIDLRHNGGGWDNQGEELFTYLIDTPAYYYRKFHTVTDSSEFLQFSSVSKEELANIKNKLIPEADGTFTVKEEYEPTLSIQHPKPNKFNGKIYFLIDGASASTTAEFLAVAHSNKLGVFIGEETGGNYTGGNGGQFISLTLPATKIQVGIPLLYYDNAVNKPLLEGRGTIPDYIVPYNIKDVLTGTDTQLNFTFDLINKRANKN
jgi:C-terminal processing protease CtpA/Prc